VNNGFQQRNWFIGVRDWAFPTSNRLVGHIDNVRITKGVSRYKGSAYTPATGLLPNQAVIGVASTKLGYLSDVDTNTSAPTSNQSLTWNGTNWVPGFPELRRLSLDHTTASLAVDSAEDFTIASGDVFQLLSITASTPAWIRIYGTSAARTADTRTEPGGTFPAPGSEFYAEIVTDTPAEQVRLAPIPTILATSGLSYVRVVNRDTSSQAIALQFQTIVMDA
jgi:hypothetical protein